MKKLLEKCKGRGRTISVEDEEEKAKKRKGAWASYGSNKGGVEWRRRQGVGIATLQVVTHIHTKKKGAATTHTHR